MPGPGELLVSGLLGATRSPADFGQLAWDPWVVTAAHAFAIVAPCVAGLLQEFPMKGARAYHLTVLSSRTETVSSREIETGTVTLTEQKCFCLDDQTF